jgi:hypothetical protein
MIAMGLDFAVPSHDDVQQWRKLERLISLESTSLRRDGADQGGGQRPFGISKRLSTQAGFRSAEATFL